MTDLRPGTRVRLLRSDQYTRLAPGSLGTVRIVDRADTVHVSWDNGSQLGLSVGAGDRFEIIGQESQDQPSAIRT
jgi:hypothetical protein